MFYSRTNYALALEHYRAARSRDPGLIGIETKIRDTEIRLYFQRGDDAVERSEWEAAERHYSEVRRLDPGNVEVDKRLAQLKEKRANAHFLQGQRYFGRGNPFDAIAEFEQALTFQPDHPRAAQALERAIVEKRDREARAENSFQQGLRALSIDKLEEAVRS